MNLFITGSDWRGVNDMQDKREDMKMSSKKRIAAVALTVAALSLGSIGFASADDKGASRSAAKSAAHDAKHAANKAAHDVKHAAKKAAHDANRAANKAAHDAQHAAKEALVATTIGVDAATIKTRLAAGETLAAIAGAKKDALITALVAFKTTNIDARVAAGTMTAAQATAKKAELTAHVTAKVNAVRGEGKAPKGPKPPKAPRP
jgi:hypothetical protein